MVSVPVAPLAPLAPSVIQSNAMGFVSVYVTPFQYLIGHKYINLQKARQKGKLGTGDTLELSVVQIIA